MSLVHDLAESLVGDITPNSGVSKEEKYRREQVGVEARPPPLAHTRWLNQGLSPSTLDSGLSSFYGTHSFGFQEAVELLAKYLSGTNAAAAEELQTLWLEYEAGETAGMSTDGLGCSVKLCYSAPSYNIPCEHSHCCADAKVVKDLDKFDMVLQALEYEARYKGPGALGEFFKSVHGG